MSTINDLVNRIPSDLPTARAMIIGEIPIGITENHNEVFYFWKNLGLSGATLFHIDAHSDLDDVVRTIEEVGEDGYYKFLEINNFICAAVHYGIVHSQGYWLNPQEDRYNLRGLELDAEIKKFGPFDRIRWNKSSQTTKSPEEVIAEQEKEKRPLLLDIDIDAFSCNGKDPYGLKQYQSYGYEERIAHTFDLLRKLRRPALVTITRSQAHLGKGGETYVDPKLVDEVQDKVIEGLVGLYGEKILL